MTGTKKFSRILALVALASLLSVGSVAQAELIIGVTPAFVTGSQEVPPVSTSAAGGGVLSVDPDTGDYNFELLVSGLTQADLAGVGPNSSPVHIHSAPVGVNGPIVVDLGYAGTLVDIDTDGFSLTASGTFGGTQGGLNGPDVATNIADLLTGNLYVNVHTNAHGGGEIRGQLLAIPEPSSVVLALLSGLGLVLVYRRK